MDIRKVKKLIELLEESGIAEIEITEEGASITIRLQRRVTVQSLAVWVTSSPGLAVAKDVTFADGVIVVREIVRIARYRVKDQ